MTRRAFLRSMGWGAATAVGTLGYGDQTSKQLELVERELAVPNWSADGFKIGVIADPHMDSPEATERAQDALMDLFAKGPDVVVFVGDFLTSAHPNILENTRKTLALTNDAPCPCYGILGNHDYWAGWFSLVLGTLSSSKMVLLRNQTAEVQGVRICGLDDALMKRHSPEAAKAEKNTVLLLHEPDYVKDLPKGASLQISGHSHGGQICWPGGSSIHTPKGARTFISGFYPDNDIPVYVSRGVGTTGPNWRLFCPPEATILTLKGS
jgi:predicted MPP superfamily phosphohydrolase